MSSPEPPAIARPLEADFSPLHRSAAGRAVLSLGELLYRIGSGTRNALFEAGVLGVHRLPCPVISIGNLTAGGTGKTPLVEWFLTELVRRGRRVAVLSRGYGRQPDGSPDDEAFVVRPHHTGAVRLVDPCRSRSARLAVEKHGVDCLLLDDGFQHRRLARDLDVVVIDATNPFGFGRLLPRGLLREPPRALRRAGLVVINRVDQVSDAEWASLEERIRALAAETCPIARAVQRPVDVVDLRKPSAPPEPVERLRGRRVAALAAIGNPGAYFRTLESLGAVLVHRLSQPDHRPWSWPVILPWLHPQARLRHCEPRPEGIVRVADQLGPPIDVEAVVATEKDAASLREAVGNTPLPVKILRIAAEFISGADRVHAALNAVLARPAAAAAVPAPASAK